MNNIKLYAVNRLEGLDFKKGTTLLTLTPIDTELHTLALAKFTKICSFNCKLLSKQWNENKNLAIFVVPVFYIGLPPPPKKKRDVTLSAVGY